MGQDAFQITVNCIKLVVVFLMMVQAVPILVWLERRWPIGFDAAFGGCG